MNSSDNYNNKHDSIIEKIRENESKAKVFRDNGQLDEAIELYEENLKTGVFSEFTCRGLWGCYRNQNNTKKTIEIIKRVITLCEENNTQTLGAWKNELKREEEKLRLEEEELRLEEEELKRKEEKWKKLKPIYDKLSEAKFYLDENAVMENGKVLSYSEKISKAIKIYEKILKSYCPIKRPYNELSSIYHKRKEFDKEKEVYTLAIKNVRGNTYEFQRALDYVDSFLKTGKWLYESPLPSDITPELKLMIKKAKVCLKEGNKKKGINLLETAIEEGTYQNTAYFTLYKIYMKDKKYDDAIRISDLAIKNLGLFSQDKLEKWTKYKDKAITEKEK